MENYTEYMQIIKNLKIETTFDAIDFIYDLLDHHFPQKQQQKKVVSEVSKRLRT